MLFQGVKRQNIRARGVEGEVQVDFTGGLRLADEGERIEPNQLRELTNMEPLRSGGVERRSGVMPFARLTESPRAEVIPYVTAAGVELYVEGSGSIWRIKPGVIVEDTGWVLSGAGDLAGKQVGKYLYLNRNESSGLHWRRWDGTTLTVLADEYRRDAEDFGGTGLPDFNSFTQSGVPRGSQMEVWNGRAWVARPVVGTETVNASSVAFSFSFGSGDLEGQEDFYENWIYTFDGQGGDEVVKMVPLGDRMFVFLNNSIHSLTPYLGERATLFYDVERFQSNVGLAGPNAVATAPDAVWFYDRKEGLMRIGSDGSLSGHMSQLDGLQKKLGRDLSDIALGYWDGRVYVSVPEKLTGAQPTENTVTYVYEVALDSWWKHSVPFSGFYSYRPTVSTQPDATLLGVSVDEDAVVDLELENDHSHDHFTDTNSVQILGSLKTAWVDSEVPEAVKDWKALEVVYRAKTGQEIQQTAVIDWNPLQIGGRWTQDVSNSASWDDGKQAPTGWLAVGTGIVEPLYASTSPPVYPGYQENNVNELALRDRRARRDEISGPDVGTATKLARPVRTQRICSSRAVSLEFLEPASSGRWGVDRITLFYSRKPIGI